MDDERAPAARDPRLAEIEALPLAERADRYARLLEELRSELEADGGR